MPECIICGKFALSGTICATCANTKSDKEWTQIQGRIRNNAEHVTPKLDTSQRGTLKYTLVGELSKLKYDPSELSFFDTVLYGTDDGNAEPIWDGKTAFHRTRPGQNFTVVFQRDQNRNINIIGTGFHVGETNNKYKISFSDGSKKTCTRKK